MFLNPKSASMSPFVGRAAELATDAQTQRDDILRLVDVQDRHALDRARLVRAGNGIYHVVRANDERDVGAVRTQH